MLFDRVFKSLIIILGFLCFGLGTAFLSKLDTFNRYQLVNTDVAILALDTQKGKLYTLRLSKDRSEVISTAEWQEGKSIE